MSDDSFMKWVFGGASALLAAWAMRDGYACLGRIQSAAIRRATKLLPQELREDAFNEWSQGIHDAWPTELMRTIMALDTFRGAFVMRLHYKAVARANERPRRRLFGNLVSLIIVAMAAQIALKQRKAKGEVGLQIRLQAKMVRAGYWFALFVLHRYEKAGKISREDAMGALRDSAETIERWTRSTVKGKGRPKT